MENLDTLKIHKAIRFATTKHKDQVRKVSGVPYISHIIEVFGYLVQSGCETDTVIGGLLHDVVEDTPTKTEEIEREFGANIANIVACESEDKSKSWKERKSATIDRLRSASVAVRQIACADKLSNLISIYADLCEVGERVWDRFNADKTQIEWYFCGVIDALSLGTFPPYVLLQQYFEKVFSL